MYWNFTRSGSTGTDDSERTIGGRVDSQDSTVSDGENADPHCTRQSSVTSVSQWDIPYDELDRGEIIGRGRFGIVYSGNWHGHVAIKELRMDYVNDEKTLEAFKAEVSNYVYCLSLLRPLIDVHFFCSMWFFHYKIVLKEVNVKGISLKKSLAHRSLELYLLQVSTFRKTRHENLVLFMGACMKPPRLAIVTSLCKGRTLYTHIHVQKDKFNMSKTIMIAQQISQVITFKLK